MVAKGKVPTRQEKAFRYDAARIAAVHATETAVKNIHAMINESSDAAYFRTRDLTYIANLFAEHAKRLAGPNFNRRIDEIGRKGFALMVVIVSMALIGIISVASLMLSRDEQMSADAYLYGMLDRYRVESDIQQAYAALDLDSVAMPLPGDSVAVGWGVWFHRFTDDPSWRWSDSTWVNIDQIYMLSKRPIRIWFRGHPRFLVPVAPQDAPGDPDPNAWKCILQSKCTNSPNFALDTLPARIVASPGGYYESR